MQLRTAYAATVRWRYVVLAGWMVAVLLVRGRTVGDWSFFVQGADRLLGHGGSPLHLYADAPQTQIGPAALVAALPLTRLPGGRWLARCLIVGLALAGVRAAELLAQRLRPARDARRWALLGGLASLPMWAFVAASVHLDDAMALSATAAAMVAVARGRTRTAALLLGTAVAAKPWALAAAPLLLALPHRRVRALAWSGGVVAIWWLPFLVAAPRTVSALASFRLHVGMASSLRTLGLTAGTLAPGWVRPAQLALSAAVALVVVRAGRWWAVPLVAFAVRLLLDPGSAAYYGAGVTTGALVFDLASGARVPWLTVGAFTGLYLPSWFNATLGWGAAAGVARTATSLCLLAAALARHASTAPMLITHPTQPSRTAEDQSAGAANGSRYSAAAVPSVQRGSR